MNAAMEADRWNLGEVQVRPVRDLCEQRRWDRLVGGGVSGWRPEPLDRLDVGAAGAAPVPDRQPCPNLNQIPMILFHDPDHPPANFVCPNPKQKNIEGKRVAPL